MRECKKSINKVFKNWQSNFSIFKIAFIVLRKMTSKKSSNWPLNKPPWRNIVFLINFSSTISIRWFDNKYDYVTTIKKYWENYEWPNQSVFHNRSHLMP